MEAIRQLLAFFFPALVLRISRETAARREAVSVLTRRRRVSAMSRALHDPRERHRDMWWEITYSLSTMPSSTAVLAALREALGHTDNSVREKAVLTLAKHTGSEDLGRFVEMSELDEGISVRKVCCEVLGEHGDHTVKDSLLASLGDPFPEVRRAAADGLRSLHARCPQLRIEPFTGLFLPPYEFHIEETERDLRALMAVDSPDLVFPLVRALRTQSWRSDILFPVAARVGGERVTTTLRAELDKRLADANFRGDSEMSRAQGLVELLAQFAPPEEIRTAREAFESREETLPFREDLAVKTNPDYCGGSMTLHLEDNPEQSF